MRMLTACKRSYLCKVTLQISSILAYSKKKKKNNNAAVVVSATARTVHTETCSLAAQSQSSSQTHFTTVSSERSCSLELLQRVPVVLIHVVRLQETGIWREGAEDLPQLLVRHTIRTALQLSEQELLQI